MTNVAVAKKRKKSSYFAKDKITDGFSIFFLLLPYALMFSLFIAIPVAMAIALSFTYFDVIQVPEPIGFLNYIVLLTQDEVFLKYVLPNTFKYALLVGPGGYIMSFLIAWMLAQVQKLPRTIMSLAIYTPSMAGGIFVGIVWKTIFSGSELGIINSFLINNNLIERPIQFLQSPEYLMTIMIVVSLWSAMGVGFLAMVAGILNINEELYEAAYMDGIKSRFQEIVYITVPSMKPQMLFGAVMAIVNAFNTGYIGVTLSGANPTPQYSGQLILNHIEDFAYQRYEMGYAAAVSVALLVMIWFFSKVAYALFTEKDDI